MSKYNVGDKFEIEIGEVFKGAESGNDKYRIKGFDSLVFDDKGLDKIRENTPNYNFCFICAFNGLAFEPPKRANANEDFSTKEYEDITWSEAICDNVLKIFVWAKNCARAEELAYRCWVQINYRKFIEGEAI